MDPIHLILIWLAVMLLVTDPSRERHRFKDKMYTFI